ncbi:UPF0158 family protein [Rhodanobacter ginsengiterrae]|uniref:UPF0158 family protein n=1 Tax=Rhodanobacter ginsengiterrae TaxID=2008451 RepID=UPI003CF3373E
MNRIPIRTADLFYAFEYVGSSAPGENTAYLCVPTGEFHFHSEIGDNLEALPDDVEDTDKYLPIPHWHDLDLGQQLVRDFTAECLPDAQDQVRDIFHHRGAYRRFKHLLERRDMLSAWHAYQQRRQGEAMRQWCVDNEVGIRD